MSYANGCISEYLGSHIFAIVGIPVQETLLGTYTKNGKEKIVVACKDFTSGGLVLQDFASLKNTIIDSVHNGYGTELSDIIKTLPDICVSCISNADYLRITTCIPYGISTQPICCRKAPANRWRHPCWVMRIRRSWSAPTATHRMR